VVKLGMTEVRREGMTTSDRSTVLEDVLTGVVTGLASGTPDVQEIAYRLATAGVTGDKHSAGNCPLANFTTRAMRDMGSLEPSETIRLYWYGATEIRAKVFNGDYMPVTSPVVWHGDNMPPGVGGLPGSAAKFMACQKS
jgi:hypothetical protein